MVERCFIYYIPYGIYRKRKKGFYKGEVYFEVTKNKEHPFVVETRSEPVKVIGTQFNINAYEDEGKVKTTLVEGAVMINDKILKPGEAFINGKIVTTDISKDVAWKNGLFDFTNLNIEEIMRQAARWYDIDVTYEGNISEERYKGKVARNTSLNEFMKILSLNGIHYRINGRKLIIMP